MNSGLPSLLRAIYGKNDLASVTLEELQDVIHEFPSFNAGHYFLAKKMKLDNDVAFEKESMRTALYFNNSFWLQSVLEDGNHIRSEIPAIDPGDKSDDNNVKEPEHEDKADTIEHVENPISEVSIGQDFVFVPENNEGTVTSFDELMSKYHIEDLVDESAVDIMPEFTPEVEENNFVENLRESGLPSTGTADTDPILSMEKFEMPEEVLNEYGIFEENPVEKESDDEDMDAFDSPAVQKPIENDLIEKVINPESSEIETENILESSIVEKTSFQSDAGDYDAFDRPTVVPAQELSDIPAQTTVTNAELRHEVKFDSTKADSIVFAPYHMIDYFASQGIKLVLEENPADQFGKQLKSFTDWLKVMKKLPPKPGIMSGDDQETEKIRHFAAHSIEERDILTESMAEVLAKQGMFENAIALYQKLSLIYPPKSAYFASRIEQLKASLT